MYEVSVIAGFSAFFYASLAIVAGGYYYKFRRIQLESPSKDTYYHSKFGRYDTPKVSFFLVLMISACMDIPLYIGCLVQGGPHDCEWDSLSYAIGWFLHLIAVCGYAYTIMIPCILWNDIIMNKDGKLFQSQFPSDSTKRFFQVALILYVLNTAIDTIAAMVSYRVHDHNHYTDTNRIDDTLTFTEPLLIFSITVGCFWCGLRLQSYVMRAKLGWKTELKFLLHLNIPMLVIMCTYLTRALFVLRLVRFIPTWYKDAMKTSYLTWIIVTRWLPYIFCSIVLVLMMRFSGAEVAAKHSKTNSQIAGINSPSPRRTKSIKDSLLENDHLLGSGTHGRGSEDLMPLGSGREYKKKTQSNGNGSSKRSASFGGQSTTNHTVSSLSSSGMGSANTTTHQTITSSGTGGGTRNVLHKHSSSGRSISESATSTHSSSNVNGIPVVPAASSLDRSHTSYMSNSRKHLLSKLTLPSLYDDEPRSETSGASNSISMDSNSIDAISGISGGGMTANSISTGITSTNGRVGGSVIGSSSSNRGGVSGGIAGGVGVGAGAGNSVAHSNNSLRPGQSTLGPNGRSIYLQSYEEEPSFLSDDSNDPLGLHRDRRLVEEEREGVDDEETRRILRLEDPHMLGVGNDDEYYSTSGYGGGYGYEENQSSLESMGTREFSVEYFLHQTMFINMARSFNSSTNGQSPPKFSIDETQPFI